MSNINLNFWFGFVSLCLVACGGSVGPAQSSDAPVCVSSIISDAGDQSVCPGVVLTVECSAPASDAELAGFGNCAAGLAHANTYCCEPNALGFECGATERAPNGAVTYGIFNALETRCEALGGECRPADPTQANSPVFCSAQQKD